MWRAAGAPENRKPTDWLYQAETQTFVRYVSTVTASQNSIIAPERDHDGGIWVNWQIGLAYAKHLSPEFDAWCNNVIRIHMEGRQTQVQYVTQSDLMLIANSIVDRMSGMERSLGAFQDETRSRFDLLSEQISGVSKPRKPISAKTKGTITIDTAKLGGMCPCCSLISILDANGGRVSEAEYDHFYSNQLPEPENVWLICKPCHDKLSSSRILRTDVDTHFRSFQMRRKSIR
jgi:hypothetical protein